MSRIDDLDPSTDSTTVNYGIHPCNAARRAIMAARRRGPEVAAGTQPANAWREGASRLFRAEASYRPTLSGAGAALRGTAALPARSLRAREERLVEVRSDSADLVLLGFTSARLERRGVELFQRFPTLRDTLFVSAEEEIDIE